MKNTKEWIKDIVELTQVFKGRLHCYFFAYDEFKAGAIGIGIALCLISTIGILAFHILCYVVMIVSLPCCLILDALSYLNQLTLEPVVLDSEDTENK